MPSHNWKDSPFRIVFCISNRFFYLLKFLTLNYPLYYLVAKAEDSHFFAKQRVLYYTEFGTAARLHCNASLCRRFSLSWYRKVHKGQLILKMLFWCVQFFQKMNENNSIWGTIVESNCFVCFLEEFKIPKRHFEINWPLANSFLGSSQ